eukprot:1193209-Prorocentrum_minimum.AAC.2
MIPSYQEDGSSAGEQPPEERMRRPSASGIMAGMRFGDGRYVVAREINSKTTACLIKQATCFIRRS